MTGQDNLSGTPTTTRRSAVAATVAILVAGGFILGQLTNPPVEGAGSAPSSAPPAVPTTTLPITVQGFQPSWEVAARLEDHEQLIGVHHVAGRLLWYVDDFRPGIGIREYGSDGVVRTIGAIPVADGANRIMETGFGLHVIGHDRDGQPTVWRSSDGLNWDPVTLPGLPGGERLEVHGLHGSDRLLLAIGSSDHHDHVLWLIAWTRVQEIYGDPVRFVTWEETGGRVRFFLFERLGLVVDVVDAEDLGIDPELYRASDPPQYRLAVWASTDGFSWTLAPESSIQLFGEMFTGPDGRIWVNGHNRGNDLLATSDGTEWVKVGRASDVTHIQPWGSGYVGRRANGGAQELVYSANSEQWEDLMLGRHLGSDDPWSLTPVVASDTGIGVVAQRPAHLRSDPGSAGRPSITRDEYTLVVNSTHLEVRVDDRVVARANRWWPGEDPGFEIDTTTGTVSFYDPEGTTIATFTLDDLAELTLLYGADTPRYPNMTEQGFFFSDDAESWTVQDITAITDGAFVTDLYLVDDRAFLVGSPKRVGQKATVWVARLSDGE